MNQNRQLARLPEPADVGQLVVRSAKAFAQKHRYITGGYFLGLLTLLFIGSGTQLTYQQRQQYNRYVYL
jgi:hypothetical protein